MTSGAGQNYAEAGIVNGWLPPSHGAIRPAGPFETDGSGRRIMGQPAARVTDMHLCPMATPGLPPVPHVGGPIIKGCPTVLIGYLPAARVGDTCVCVGPPDVIVMGSFTVLIGGSFAARVGDTTAHGGKIVIGMLNVMIG